MLKVLVSSHSAKKESRIECQRKQLCTTVVQGTEMHKSGAFLHTVYGAIAVLKCFIVSDV